MWGIPPWKLSDFCRKEENLGNFSRMRDLLLTKKGKSGTIENNRIQLYIGPPTEIWVGGPLYHRRKQHGVWVRYGAGQRCQY